MLRPWRGRACDVETFFGIKDLDDARLAEAAELWVARGETEAVEFKRELPRTLQDLGKEFAAFATTNDGVILIGVADNGEWIGLEELKTVEGRQVFRSRIEGVLTNGVAPHISPVIRFVARDGRFICVVFVKKGPEPVYYASGVPYLRQVTVSRRATPEEVNHLVLRGGVDRRGDVDFTAWRGVDRLTLRQAACLWAGRDPAAHTAGDLMGEPGARLEILRRAAREGALRTIANPEAERVFPETAPDHAFVRPRDLQYLATLRDETPAFLGDEVEGSDFQAYAEEAGLWLETADCELVTNPGSETWDLKLMIANKSGHELRNVTVAISDMWRADWSRIVPMGTNRLDAPQVLGPGANAQITMLARDQSKRGSWMLRLFSGPQILSADEEATFKLALMADGEDLTRATLKVTLRGRVAQTRIIEQSVIPI